MLSENGSVQSASFIVSASDGSIHLEPVVEVLSSLPNSDLVILSTATGKAHRTLPVSPYPAPNGTHLRAHFICDEEPPEQGWEPWIAGTWRKWASGTLLGYRGPGGREAEVGTYDRLSQVLFHPPPTFGSSGGPIVDEETGAVVGVILGTGMDNRVEGLRGYGAPAEMIFEECVSIRSIHCTVTDFLVDVSAPRHFCQDTMTSEHLIYLPEIVGCLKQL